MFSRLLFIFLLLSACKTEHKGANTISQSDLALIFCQCGELLQEYNSKLQLLVEEGDISLLADEMKRGDIVFNETVECISSQVPLKLDNTIFTGLHVKIDENCQLDPRMSNDLIRKMTELIIKE